MADYPSDSLANYCGRSSYGLLDLSNGATLGWYKTDYDRIDVLENRDGWENLIKEALRHYEDEHHFSQYDNDGDGFIDYFMVFWTGENTGWGSFLWAYQTGWNDGLFFLDGKRLRSKMDHRGFMGSGKGNQSFQLWSHHAYAALRKPRHARPGWSGCHRHAFSHKSAMRQPYFRFSTLAAGNDLSPTQPHYLIVYCRSAIRPGNIRNPFFLLALLFRFAILSPCMVSSGL